MKREINKKEENRKFSHYNFLQNRKGLSSIVVTLIIIVLSLVAIGVVWGVVRGILNQGTTQSGLEKFTISLDIKNAYEQDGNIIVNVQRAIGEGELVKIKFLFSNGNNFESITQDSVMKPLDYQNFFIKPTQLISTEILSVSVAPIFKSSSGEEIVGTATDSYTIGSNGQDGSTGLNPPDNPLCTPDCSNLACGIDPICGELCGFCTGTDTCTNGICVSLNCVQNSNEITCGEQTCGNRINNCGLITTCLPGCSSGTRCEDGTCVEILSINEGTVEEVWPGTSGMYFGSVNLPTNTDYSRKYIKFLESLETRCLLIAVYRFPVEGYEKSHIGFNFETSILTGENYQVFETAEECLAS